jgi:Zn-dependent peptidase ImmA (M78 family)
VKNINDLLISQADVSVSVRNGSLAPDVAREISRSNGVLISAINTQIKYAKAVGEKVYIDFIKTKKETTE